MFYIFNGLENKVTNSFDNLNSVILFLRSFTFDRFKVEPMLQWEYLANYSKSDRYYNEYVCSLATSFSEVEKYLQNYYNIADCVGFWKPHYILIFSDEGYIFNPCNYKNEILKPLNSKKPNTKTKRVCAKFRYDEIPYTGKRKSYDRHYKSYGKFLKLAKQEDYGITGRNRYKEKLLCYGTWYHSDNGNSWKNFSKKKHQWMKNL